MCVQIRVKIFGLNLSKIIDYLIESNVFLNNVIVKNKYVIFSIDKRDIDVLNKVCRRENKIYQVINPSPTKRLIYKIKRFFGVVFALIISSIYLLSFSSTIQKIEIINETEINYNLNKIDIVLADIGVKVGANKYSLKRNEIENCLLQKLTDLSDCVVCYNGSKLSVKIIPDILKYEISESDVYSKYDSIITKIDVYSGESNLKVGDIVKQGDLLIKNNIGASGSIKGKVYFSASELYNARQEKIIYSGAVEVFHEVLLFNKNIIKPKISCHFSKYLAKKCDFYLFNNYFLPVKVNSIYCYEYDLLEEYIEFSSVEDKIKKSVYNNAFLKIPDNAEVVNHTYSVVTEGDFTRVDCFIETIVDLV